MNYREEVGLSYKEKKYYVNYIKLEEELVLDISDLGRKFLSLSDLV